MVDRCVCCRREQASVEDIARCEAEKDDTARGAPVSRYFQLFLKTCRQDETRI